VRDQGDALRAFGKIARDRTIETQGVEIRLRAERRLGEMIEAAKTAGDLKEGRPKKRGDSDPVSRNLKAQGVDKNLAKRARTLARISAGEFEDKVSKLKEKVSDTTRRVVAKEFYKERNPPVINMNGIARRFSALLETTLNSEKKGGTYLYNISEYADQITDKDTKRELVKKIDWTIQRLTKAKQELQK
jgi:hypothetical protein